jgi:Na+(H+)/acetate symporter ActP
MVSAAYSAMSNAAKMTPINCNDFQCDRYHFSAGVRVVCAALALLFAACLRGAPDLVVGLVNVDIRLGLCIGGETQCRQT